MTENNKDKPGSPSWELFWQEHGQSLFRAGRRRENKKRDPGRSKLQRRHR